MTAPSQSVYRIADVRAVERALPSAELMARAGAAAFALLRDRWPEARHLVVVAGPGNNGGDGRVLARLAQKAGYRVAVVDLDAAATAIPGCDVIVDALFGIGLSRAPDGAAAALIEAMNAHPAPVLALDVPSGLDADRGEAPGAVVVADATIAFLCHKPGLFNGVGPRCGGVVSLASLDVPSEVFEGCTPVADVIPPGLAGALLGARPRDAHKGDFGHVLVIGGNEGMGGAATLAADAALRCGAGRVTVAVASGFTARVSARAEAMVRELDATAALVPLLERASVVAIGPGLGTDAWARAMLDAALACGKPLVADADALNLIAERPTRRADWIVTPHPGEAARLLATTTTEIQRDRLVAVHALAGRTGAVVVLKGAATVVAGGVRPRICTAGNPGMAGAGMGDLLTGVIAALWAQGLGAADAAAAGVQLHAEAGDLTARDGERGLLAGDLMWALRRRVNALS